MAKLAFHPPTQIHAPGKKLPPGRLSKTAKLPLTIQRPVTKATPLGPQGCRGRMDPHLSTSPFRKLPPRPTEGNCRGFAPARPPGPTPHLSKWRPGLRSQEQGALTPCFLARPRSSNTGPITKGPDSSSSIKNPQLGENKGQPLLSPTAASRDTLHTSPCLLHHLFHRHPWDGLFSGQKPPED